MTSVAPTTSLWPDQVELYLLECEDFLDAFAYQDYWTPFEAACLIRGCKPGEISEGAARVGVVLPHALDQQSIDDFDPKDTSTSDDLIRLTRVIVSNNDGAPRLKAQAIVQWAVGAGRKLTI